MTEREWGAFFHDANEKIAVIKNGFDNDGFVCLSGLIHIEEWKEWSEKHFLGCFEVLCRNGHTAFPQHQKDGQYAMSGNGVKNGFREVVMRSPGRYELSLLHHPEHHPSLEPLLASLRELVPALLSETSWKICHVSLLVATPGATDQSWHSDGGHVDLDHHAPCHCFNVFVPLVDVTKERGPTEFRPGSHFLTRNLASMMLLAKARKTLRPTVLPTPQAGDAVIFDYRVLHRGRANTSTQNRTILVVTFAKSWFNDLSNFPKRSIYEKASI